MYKNHHILIKYNRKERNAQMNYLFKRHITYLCILISLFGCDKKEHNEQAATASQLTSSPMPNTVQNQPQSTALINPYAPENMQQAPPYFKVIFTTTKGTFVTESHREWAPHGVDRFYTLAKNGYYANNAFFRVVPNFIVQFGINPDITINAAWNKMEIPDDVTLIANTRGTLSYGTRGPNTRTTHLVINFKDNSRHLDPTNAVIARIIEGIDIVDNIYSGYGDLPQFGGKSPEPQRMNKEGSGFLSVEYPKLDYILSTEIMLTAD